jgi:ribonucleoside-diphosphate reductase alpha chain
LSAFETCNTTNQKIGYAKSIVDYIFRWLELKFIRGDQGDLFGAVGTAASSPTDANRADPVGALGELKSNGRCACLQYLRLADGTQRNLLSMHDLWEHEWVLVVTIQQTSGIDVSLRIR